MTKSAVQLDREIAEALARPLLKDDWPDFARRYARDAAASHESLDKAVDNVIRQLERDQGRGVGDFYTSASPIEESWYARYESGEIEAELRTAIQAARRRTSSM